MKNISDLIQIGLSLPGVLAMFAAVLISLCAVFFARSGYTIIVYAIAVARWLWAHIFRIRLGMAVMVCVLSVAIYLGRWQIIDALQYWEQTLQPAYVSGDTSTHALAIYETELGKYCDQYEAEIVKRRTREIAAKIGCSPLAIYEVAYSECGMNPFCIRKDGIAAGWIQFTTVGLTGLDCSLEDVKAYCRNRDTERIMALTERYFISRSGGKKMTDATDVYVATFAPGYLGSADGQVLYAGLSNPAYYLNDIFDGYFAKVLPDGRRQIFRTRSAIDGRITIGELRLHLEAKKAKLINNYKKL